MGKRQPSAPDPAETAKAQGTANLEAAIAQGVLNNTNQITPYGSLTFDKIGSESVGGQNVPRYQATTQLSPDQQRMLELTNRAGIQYGETANTQLGAVRDRLSQPLDFSGLGAVPQANEETRQNVAQSIRHRNQPQFDRRYDQLQTRLANQGLSDPNSDAYKSATDEYYRSLNDFDLAADQQAGSEMQRMFGLETGSRNQAINEMVQQRQIPLNELAAMLTGSQVQSPSFVNTPQSQIAPTDIMGATYAGYDAQSRNAAAQNQGFYDLLGSAATAGAFAWSDRRLKRDIEQIGVSCGLPLYAFRYNWSDEVHIGFMADEVREFFPEAVIRVGDYDMVNYGAIQ